VGSRTDRDTPGAATANRSSAVVVDQRAPFRMRASAWAGVPNTGAAKLWLVGELDFATRRDLAWSNGASADIAVVAADGRSVASVQVPFATSDGGFMLQVPTDTPLESGDYAIRVRVTPQAGDALPLADLVRVSVPDAPMPLGEAVMLRRGTSTGPRFIATADPRFRRSDRVRLEIPTQLEIMPTARLLDRSGNPLRVPVQLSDRRDAASGFRWIVADATLAPLAPGEYAIEVTAGTARSLTPLRIVP
jgi:hypothetical protein